MTKTPEKHDIPLKKRDFQAALESLVSSWESSSENPGSYRGERNERCIDCMFTERSEDCYKCTYCFDCKHCTHATHCRESSHLHHSSYCVRSQSCTGSSYLVYSRNCHDCVFCFGCVGLVGAEFHILNQKFSRNDYFALLAELERIFNVSRR